MHVPSVRPSVVMLRSRTVPILFPHVACVSAMHNLLLDNYSFYVDNYSFGVVTATTGSNSRKFDYPLEFRERKWTRCRLSVVRRWPNNARAVSENWWDQKMSQNFSPEIGTSLVHSVWGAWWASFAGMEGAVGHGCLLGRTRSSA